MKLFKRSGNPPLAPEAAAMVATAKATARLLTETAAEFNRVYGDRLQPETVHVDSERVDPPQLES